MYCAVRAFRPVGGLAGAHGAGYSSFAMGSKTASGHLRPRAGALVLLALSALHVVWASGSSWPLSDRRELADAVVGRRDGRFPGYGACLLVAFALAAAAAGVARSSADRGRGARLISGATAGVLSVRGAAGLAGRTDLLSPGSVSPRFRRLDRRIYSPLALALAALCVPRRPR